MKKYFHKELTERPRYGSRGMGDINRSQLGKSKEDYPEKESMRKLYPNRKGFSDHIKPLYRFLLSNVGRPWNDVNSEISTHIKLSSTVQRHILEHVSNYVLKDIDIINGEPYYRTKQYGSHIKIVHTRGNYIQLYIDPRNGSLCKAKTVIPESKKAECTLIIDPTKPNIQFRKIQKRINNKYSREPLYKTSWFRLELKPTPEPVTETKVKWVGDQQIRTPYIYTPGKDCYLLNRLADIEIEKLEYFYGSSSLYCFRMSDVNSKELAYVKKVIG